MSAYPEKVVLWKVLMSLLYEEMTPVKAEVTSAVVSHLSLEEENWVSPSDVSDLTDRSHRDLGRYFLELKRNDWLKKKRRGEYKPTEKCKECVISKLKDFNSPDLDRLLDQCVNTLRES